MPPVRSWSSSLYRVGPPREVQVYSRAVLEVVEAQTHFIRLTDPRLHTLHSKEGARYSVGGKDTPYVKDP